MKQNKTKKKFVSIVTIFLIVALVYGFLPLPNTAKAVDSMTNASDRLTDSDVGVSAMHTITFTTTVASPAVHIIDIVFPVGATGFTALGAAGWDCGSGNYTASRVTTNVANDTLRCTANGVNAAGVHTFHATTTNPTAGNQGTKVINIIHKDTAAVGGVVLERAQVLVAIIDDITMTAHVDATLTFVIDGMTSAETVNGVACSVNTTATTTDFGTLAPTVAKSVCQELRVTTNAAEGYTVTVQQDQELTSSAGTTINSFRNSPDGTGSTTPQAWAAPAGRLNMYNEYGHMGLTSNDQDLVTYGYGNFYNGGVAAHYAGLNGRTAMVVMHHNGPADGTTQSAGLAQVAYTAQITALQEAGDYDSAITYVATPTY